MHTRREIITNGLGLAAIIAAGKAPAAVVRSMVAARNAAMFGGKSLPYDAEVEWLQGDGNAYINTGIIPQEGDWFKIKMSVLPQYGYQSYLGCAYNLSYGGPIFVFMSPFNDRRFEMSHGNRYIWPTVANSTNVYQDGNIHTFECHPDLAAAGGGNTNTIIIDNVGHSYRIGGTSETYGIPNLSLFLFCRNYNGTPSLFVQSQYRLRINEYEHFNASNTKISSFISVSRGNIGYMYDRVSKKLFGNAGTGEFTVGPIKS